VNKDYHNRRQRTGDTVVGDLEVGSEVAGARLAGIETRHGEPTAAQLAGAHGVRLGAYIGRAADVSVVAPDAPAEPHATVQRRPDDSDLGRVDGRTTTAVGIERLQLTEVARR